MASDDRHVDIVEAGVSVRYKVYPEKKRKPKIKYCIGFDDANPTPEREWAQFRDDGDPDAAVRGAVRKELGTAGVVLSADGNAAVSVASRC